jgi:hypothetical protein
MSGYEAGSEAFLVPPGPPDNGGDKTEEGNDTMKFIRSMVIAGYFILLAGCSGKDLREGIYQGVYEGARIENQNELSPRERASKPDMDYQQYTNERKMHDDEPR